MSKKRSSPLRLYSSDSERGERHATWLELFFDLVFVVAIAQVAHLLYDDLTWTGIASFAVLFVPVWWLWIDFSYYADQFDVERGIYRVTMLGVMFGMIILAITIPGLSSIGTVNNAKAKTFTQQSFQPLFFMEFKILESLNLVLDIAFRLF